MLSIFSASSIATEETVLYIHFSLSIILLVQQVPHAKAGLSVLVLRRGDEHLHLDSNFFGDIGHFDLNVLCLSLSLLDAQLVCKNNYLISFLRQFFQTRADFIVKEDPVVSIFWEFGATFSGDDGVIKVERSDFGTLLESGRLSYEAAAHLGPVPFVSFIFVSHLI